MGRENLSGGKYGEGKFEQREVREFASSILPSALLVVYNGGQVHYDGTGL